MRTTALIFMLVVVNCFSQNKQILYNTTSIPQSLWSNPGADVTYNWFAGVPLLSGLSVQLGSSGFSAFDLFANNGIDFNEKIKNVVSSITRNDKISLNQQLDLFSGGFKIGDWQHVGYLSFGLYQESDLLLYMPKDYASLLLEGNQNYVGKIFNAGDFNAKAEVLSVFHVGYHKKIKEKFVVGARGKIYSSIMNFKSTSNSGSFYTVPVGSSVYDQVISVDGLVNTSGLIGEGSISGGNVIKKTLLGGNLGVGLDLGFTYYLKKNLQVTASAIDIGFIRHSKEVENYSLKGSYKHEGIALDFINDNSLDFREQLVDAISLDTLNTKYTSLRPLKLNSSIHYSFGNSSEADCKCVKNTKYINAVGAQLFVMTSPRTPIAAVTAYYSRRFFDAIELKITYTLDSYSARNIGLGLSATFSKINFYILADNLLEYQDISKAHSLSVQFGFNFIVPFKNSIL
jgi:hypothetical protein